MRFLIYILSILCLKISAQSFNQIDFKEGLSQSTVLSIEQDDQGFVWIGTADGLNRFDGMTMETFRFALNDTSCICGNEVMDIVNDHQGNLWIATSNCLNKLDLRDYSFAHYVHDESKNQTLSGNYISQITLAAEHLVVLTENGLDVLNLETNEISNIETPNQALIKNLSTQRDGNLLITTTQGLFIYDFGKHEISGLENFEGFKYSRENIVRSFMDSTQLFIAYENEIVLFDLISNESQQLFGYEFLDTRDIDKWNELIWFSTSKGIMTYNEKTREFKHGINEGLPEREIISSFIKSGSEIWFSVGSGVLKYCKSEPLFKTLKIDVPQNGISGSNKIWHLFNEDDNITISCERGISVLSENGTISPLFEKISMDLDIQNVSNVSIDEPDIWICTFDAGLYHVNTRNKTIENYSSNKQGKFHIGSNTVRHSLVLEDEVLFCTDNGLYRYDKVSSGMNQVGYDIGTKPGSLSKKTTFSYQDNLDRLWVGTQGGLFVAGSDGQFFHFTTLSSPALSNNRVRNITPYNDSLFLIGTSSGLNLINFNQKSISYVDITSGLDNDVIYSLEIDQDKDIWIGTNKGISLVTKDGEIRNFNVHDGLQGSKFNTNASTQFSDGQLCFGGLYGVSIFNPEKVKTLHEVASPIITKMEILPHGDEKGSVIDYPLETSYELSYAQCNFILSFVSINYDNPENTVFYYKLEGYNHEWIKVDGDPEVQFMNLKQGSYEFKVRTALRNGALSENIVALKFRINPPFYQARWFRILVGLMLLILGSLIYRTRFNSVKKSNIRLQKIVKKQTKKLQRVNDLQSTFLKEIPEPLVIFNAKNEVSIENDLYSVLLSESLLNADNVNKSTKSIDQFILADVEKMSKNKLKKYESVFEVNDNYLQLKFNRIVIDDEDYGTAVLLRDITSIKVAEKALKTNEVLFRSYFEKSPIGIVYVVNPHGPISNCNDRFSDMLGMKREDVLSKTMMELTFSEDLKQDTIDFTTAAKNKARYLFQPNKRLVCNDGSVLMTEARITFIYDDNNDFQYMFVLIQDVTEQREDQKNLIEARTQLVQSEKLAALGQITAGVAHEINNPVNFIYNGVNNLKSLISTLRSSPARDMSLVYTDINEMISAIEDGAKRTAEIVKSLRMFAREDMKSKVNYDMITGIESTITLLSNKIRDGISIKRDYSYEEYLIDCFPGRLNQVFMNIILNAIESIEENGSVRIDITERDSVVEVTVTDTGSGIDPSIANRIHEPFFSTKGAKDGTGMGLSISQTIIDKHKGEIAFEDNSPKGTKCTITLPINSDM